MPCSYIQTSITITVQVTFTYPVEPKGTDEGLERHYLQVTIANSVVIPMAVFVFPVELYKLPCICSEQDQYMFQTLCKIFPS